MDKTEFQLRIEEVDKELAEARIAVHARSRLPCPRDLTRFFKHLIDSGKPRHGGEAQDGKTLFSADRDLDGRPTARRKT